MNYFRNLSFRKSVGILLLNVFLSFVFCLFVKNNSWCRSFPSSIFKFILKVALFCFWQQFLVFSVPYLLVLHSLYCTQTFIYSYNTFVVPLQNSNTVYFDCSRIVYSLIFVSSSPPTTPWSTICWIALGSTSKAFCLLMSAAISL